MNEVLTLGFCNAGYGCGDRTEWTWRFVFLHLLYLSPIVHRHNSLNVRNTIWTFVAKEMHNGLIFPPVKQCETINDELTIYLLPVQT